MFTKVQFISIIALCFGSVFVTPVFGQTHGVRQNLIQCYNASELPEVLTGNGRPPATLNIFLEFIRRLEDSNPTVDSRELSVLILQRLRQDGIMGTRRATDIRFGIPFSPKRLEAYKSTLILEQFLTNVTRDLNLGDLQPIEVCAFHYLLSSTIDNRVRNDESTTCSRSSRYTSRIFRSKREGEEGGETEVTEEPVPEAPVETEVESNPEDANVEVEGVEGFGVRSVSGSPNDISQCPIELGVVNTNHGTIKGGQVIAGLAAGWNYEVVLGSDNRYASTIAGEIAEAALAQATEAIVIGAAGGWNSTVNPRFHFLQRNTQLQATDAEIRGSLDGLFMALRLDSWRNQFSDIKISQILDMYYSPYQRGVFDESFRSCNRNLLYTEIVTPETLRAEVLAIMGPLDRNSQYGQTVSSSAYDTLTTGAMESFNRYFTQMGTGDLTCTPDSSSIERVASDFLIFLDTSWNFNTVQPILSYVLDNIDVNKYGSRYSVFNGQDGTNITSNSSTNNLLDFHGQYNLTVHQRLPNGFSYTRAFGIIESLGRAKLDNNTYSVAESTVVLLITRTPPSESDNTFLQQRREILRQYLPDVTVLVLGAGNQNNYNSVVNNPDREVLILTETTNEEQIKQIGQNLIERIQNVPRSIVNPNCGSQFTGSSSTFSLTEYVEPRGVNYYRISPNYFFNGDGTRNLLITGTTYGTINVCISRSSRPDGQTGDCETLRSQTRTIDISNYCGDSVSGCSPIHIAVFGNTTEIRCRENACRFPDNMKYTITLQNVGCASGAIRMLSNFIVVTILFSLLRF